MTVGGSGQHCGLHTHTPLQVGRVGCINVDMIQQLTEEGVAEEEARGVRRSALVKHATEHGAPHNEDILPIVVFREGKKSRYVLFI